MPAEKNKRGDIPAHDKDACRNADDRCAYRADISQVFRRKEERRGAIGTHKAAVDCAKQDSPEYQQYLELPCM
jgi:hypothetical protein